ncbi:ROK family protein [Dermabacteraceae bacterium TAE3-ERU27]|nr:ROK family protein [Dermabacteraceae bacterium TAE3-ERU27]
MQRFLALDLGGTKTTAAVVELQGRDARVLHSASQPTPAREGANSVLVASLALTRRTLTEWGGDADTVAGVGIASAGVIDPQRGLVTHATDALPGWPGTELAAAFAGEFSLPARALNDVHAHGLGEALYGAGNGHSSMLMVAVGTGIGGAIVIDGQPFTGFSHAAGHVGHIAVPEAEGVLCSCGRTGHLEGLASGPGIHALYTRRGGQAVDTKEVAARARDGERLAAEVLRLAGFATGRVIGGLLNVIDPAVVTLTGGVAQIGNLWRTAVLDGIEYDAMDVVMNTPVLDATAGVEAALLGAAAWAGKDI